jgi:hypothetical protein
MIQAFKIDFILKALGKQGLSYLAGINRPVIPGHVTKIANAIMVLGRIIRPVVVAKLPFIDGGIKYYIIDGQHLYNALIRLGVDIPCTVVEIKTQKELIEQIASLNASSKSWCLLDYIASWSSVNDDYKTLNKYYNIYDFELSIIASILNGSAVAAHAGGSSISKTIKQGTFTVYNEVSAKQKLNYLTDVFKILPRLGRVENRYACSEYLNFIARVGNKYNHAAFLKKLAKAKINYVFTTQEPGALTTSFTQLL